MASKVKQRKGSSATKRKSVKAKSKENGANKEQKKEELSIIEQAKQEKNLPDSEIKRGNGSGKGGKPITREVFKIWLILPDQFKGTPERITSLLGITDEVALELLKISTMQAFAEEFGVIPQTLSRWRKEIEGDSKHGDDVKRHLRSLTKNFMGALYRKGIEEGDAARFMAWMKVIEGWREQLGIEVSDSTSELSAEDRAELDRLVERNAVRA